jgi:integrase
MLVAMEESGLTANTARHAFVVLQKALKDAERRGLIDANPCRLVDPPAVDDFHVEPPTAMVIAEIIANVESDGFATVFKLMAATGLRRGEAVALQWSALDLGSRVLSVVQTAQRIRAGSITVMPPKTKSGMRGVAIDDATTNMLRTHRVSQQERILRSLGTIEDAGFVFPDPFGQLADPDHFTRTWRKAAKAAGHSKVRLHDVRHHHATTLMALGVNAKVVQERLGHSTPAFTLQRYSHVSEGMQAEAARLYGEESGAALSG